MRGSVIALALLLLIVAVVALNGAYVCQGSRAMIEALDALPTTPDPSETPAAVRQIRADFEARTPILGITVSGTMLDRMRGALELLESAAAAGDGVRYAEAREGVRRLAKEMARGETPSIRNVL